MTELKIVSSLEKISINYEIRYLIDFVRHRAVKVLFSIDATAKTRP